MLRFECPRCRTVFTRDRGEDDAFVECPSCGALAMSAGEATGVDSDALARTLSSTHDMVALRASRAGQHDDASETGEPGHDLGASAITTRPGQEATSSQGQVNDDNDDSSGAGGGIFSGLLGAESASGDDDGGHRHQPLATPTPAPARAAVAKGGIDLGLNDELDDFELPSTAPANRALSPARRSPNRPTRRSDADQPRPSPPPPAPGVAASLGDDAMGALEAAFDTMAARPVDARQSLSDDERRFLENVAGNGPQPPPPRGTPHKPPPRPPERPGVPRAAPPPRKKRPLSTALSLSPEARAAAFIALKRAAPPRQPGPVVAADGHDSTDPEVTAPGYSGTSAVLPPARPATRPDGAVAVAGDKVEANARRKVRERPTIMAGVRKLALAAAVLVGLTGGGIIGAATAPEPAKRSDGARARAELALADGNSYYDGARFDDAVGRYKNAISNDRTYAPAHRAKGAALAKLGQLSQQAQRNDEAQSQFDEAAAAYRDYLTLEPSAIDAADIKEALTRRGLSPVGSGVVDANANAAGASGSGGTGG